MSRLPVEFWHPTVIPPQPLLAQLRDLVLAQSEKRMPKWKFRLAPDLVAQLQPKLTTALLKFECLAVQCEGARAELLSMTRGEMRAQSYDYLRISFDLFALEPHEWKFKPKYCGWSRGTELTGFLELRDRLVAAFRDGHFDFLRPEMMLANNCLICGKGLTDPVSMARHIGPECWGSASASMPFTIDAEADAAERGEATTP